MGHETDESEGRQWQTNNRVTATRPADRSVGGVCARPSDAPSAAQEALLYACFRARPGIYARFLRQLGTVIAAYRAEDRPALIEAPQIRPRSFSRNGGFGIGRRIRRYRFRARRPAGFSTWFSPFRGG